MRIATAARIACALVCAVWTWSAHAQAHEQDHEQLRNLLAETRDAINSANFAALEPLFYEPFSATLLNQDVVTTSQELTGFFDQWFKGDTAIIKSLTMDPVADAQTEIYDGTFGIARGSNTEVYELVNGKAYTFKTRWTATVIKDEDRWKILAVHNGTNFLDNPLLAVAERAGYYYAGGALLVGVLIGFFLGRARRGRA
jgi:ketosteroid isomerase-like protein